MTVIDGELVPESPYIWRARRSASSHRLICFPHAGAGAAAYTDWVQWLPTEIELVAVQLPGRQNRILEELFVDVGRLVNVLVHALRPVLDGRFAFFGHSCGAALAYELAQALQAAGRPGPTHLFLSAQPAPDAPGAQLLHTLSDDDFRSAVLDLGGIEDEVAAEESVLDSLLPILRADFTLWEQHRATDGPALNCPITVLAGRDDPRAPIHSMDGWRHHTNGVFAGQFYQGGHFYFAEQGPDVVSFVGRRTLDRTASGRVS